MFFCPKEKNMEKIIFTKKKKTDNSPKTTAVRVNTEAHKKILDISEKTGLSVSEVAGRLITFALERVEWQ